MEVEKNGEEGSALGIRGCVCEFVPTKIFLPLLDLFSALVKLLEEFGYPAGLCEQRLNRQVPGQHSKRMPRLLESAAVIRHANQHFGLSTQTPKQNLPTGKEEDGKRCLLLPCQHSQLFRERLVDARTDESWTKFHFANWPLFEQKMSQLRISHWLLEPVFSARLCFLALQQFVQPGREFGVLKTLAVVPATVQPVCIRAGYFREQVRQRRMIRTQRG